MLSSIAAHSFFSVRNGIFIAMATPLHSKNKENKLEFDRHKTHSSIFVQKTKCYSSQEQIKKETSASQHNGNRMKYVKCAHKINKMFITKQFVHLTCTFK